MIALGGSVGSLKGSCKGSFEGSCKGFFTSSFKGSCKGFFWVFMCRLELQGRVWGFWGLTELRRVHR